MMLNLEINDNCEIWIFEEKHSTIGSGLRRNLWFAQIYSRSTRLLIFITNLFATLSLIFFDI